MLGLFCIFTLVEVLRFVLRPARVTADTLAGAVSAYLLAGLAWGALYALARFVLPGSFDMGGLDAPSSGPEVAAFMYFSLVSLTTLGCGDMTPIAPAVRPLVITEAVAEQFFLAALVARLISSYRPNRIEDRG